MSRPLMSRLPILAAAVTLLAAGTAQAHAPGGFDLSTGGFSAGLSHPFLGADHLMAMLAVGLLAVQQGTGKAAGVWLLPAVFVAAMAAGLGIGAMGLGMPVEAGVVGSVIVLGALVAWGRALPARLLAAVVAVSAALHGHAHGVEMPADGSSLAYAAGALAGTAVLHGLGVGAARMLQGTAVRACGAAFAAVAVVLVLA